MQYSKFDGFSSVEDLVGKAKEFGMSAVGITDHGTVAGIITFLKECRKKGVRPILGMESYMSRNSKCHDSKGQPEGRKGNRHLNIIAKNFIGYQNLCTLSQTACIDGYYYDPRIDWELLEKHKEGLIVTSACLSNIINHKLAVDQFDDAVEIAGGFRDIFGEDFYLEMMYHGIDLEGKILPSIQKLAQTINTKVIITNDCHYINKEDAKFQKILMCMSSQRSIRDPKRYDFPYDEFYFKSAEEIYAVFKTVPGYMRNTLEVAEKCDYSDIIFVEDGGEMRLPVFEPSFEPIDEAHRQIVDNIRRQYWQETKGNPFGYLKKLAYKGLEDIGWGESEAHKSRLELELSDIKLIWDTKRYDFSTYFLVVEDMVRFARSRGIAAGIRGSGYGSVLLHCLGLCRGADPIDQDLMWERFLGFDEKFFISEEDCGIGDDSTELLESTSVVDKSDPVSIMSERYK